MKNKTNRIHVLLFIFMVFFSSYPTLKALEIKKRHHVFIISLDALAATHLQFYGYQRKTAPFLEEFARENIIAEKAYANAAFTLNHVSMLTGVYPANHGINYTKQDIKGLDHKNRLDDSIKTIAQLLQTRDFETFWIADTRNIHLAFDRGLGRGFKNIITTGLADDIFLPGIINDLSKNKGKNIFAFIHCRITHDPYLSKPPFSGYFDPLYEGKIIGTYRDFIAKHFPKKTQILYGNFTNRELVGKIASELFPTVVKLFWQQFDLKNPKDIEHLISLYDDNIRHADFLLDKLLYALKILNLYDDSIIIITSDHGEAFGEHGTFRHVSLHEEILHIPLLIKIPGTANKSIKAQVQSIDLVPTILDALDLPIPENIDGKSLLPLLKGETTKFHDFSYANFLNSYSAWTENWKLIRNQTNDLELYNLTDDPFEKKNLWENRKEPDAPDNLKNALDKYIIRGLSLSQ